MAPKRSHIAVLAEERGSALVASVMLVFLMTVLGVALFQAGVIESGQAIYSENEMRALYAAESGLNRAVLDVADALNVGCWNNLVLNSSLLCSDGTTWGPLTATPTNVPGYSKLPFGTSAGYLVQARTDPAGNPNAMQIVATGCVPQPAVSDWPTSGQCPN